MIGRFLDDPSLQSAYESLKAQLASSGSKFLITIDDIDRLQPEEVRDIMRMVKTVGKASNRRRGWKGRQELMHKAG